MSQVVPRCQHASVVKQVESHGPVHGVSFNLEDIASRANDYLTKVKLEAARIITDAREQAEAAQREAEAIRKEAEKIKQDTIAFQKQQEIKINEEARKSGYEDGLASGRQEAEKELQEQLKEYEQRVQEAARQQLADQVQTLMPAIREAADYVASTKHQWFDLWDQSAIQLMCAISKRVIRRELETDPKIPLAYVREALELAAGSVSLKISLNQHDYETLLPEVENLVQELASVARADIIPDERVSPGGCKIETPYGVIDQQIETQLQRIAEELN